MIRPITPVLFLLLAGCAVDSAPRLVSVERAAPLTGSLAIVSEPDASPEQIRLARALKKALGPALAAEGQPASQLLTVAASRAPASLGLATEGDGPVRWLSTPRPPRRFDACRAERFHAHVAAPSFSAHGEFDFCNLDDQRIDSLAQAFARAIVAD